MIYKTIIILLFFINICVAQWTIYEPIRTAFDRRCKILEDVSSHSPQNYSDEDGAHVAHELCHFATSSLRNRLFARIHGQGRFNTFYMLNNTGYIVKEPNFKLADLAQNIPAKYRGGIYQLYLIDQQRPPVGAPSNTEGWNNTPSYILDEHCAYTVGTMTALQLGNNFRADDSGHRMLETLIYCHFLKKMAKQDDITKLVDFQTGRCELIYKKLPKTNPKVIQNYQLLQEVK